MSKEAMKLALEALEAANRDEHRELVFEYREGAITALREALAEQPAQQEPVSKEAIRYITATLAAFGPDEAISMTKETWAKLRGAIKTLAEQPAQQEPVACFNVFRSTTGERNTRFLELKSLPDGEHYFYTSPQAQPAQRKPLTDEEILAANYPDGEENGPTIAAPNFELICFARQIEAKLQEKNA